MAYLLFQEFIKYGGIPHSLGSGNQKGMEILFYSKTHEEALEGQELELRLGIDIPGIKLRVYQSIEDLARGIFRRLGRDILVILRVQDREDLLNTDSIKDMLQNLRVILILPDRDEDTIALAHRVRPRFLGTDEDHYETVKVVKKMLGHQD